MNPEEFVNLAGWLAANSSPTNLESRYRSAASRAYYGAFLIAAKVLGELGSPIPKNHTGHDVVVKTLLATKHGQAISAARLIHDLRTIRNAADYNLNTEKFRNQEYAKAIVDSAVAAVAGLRACLDEPIRSELKHLLTRSI